MPVYTYRCENCGVQFERQQSFSDRTIRTCPECGKKALRRVYRPVGIVFKGSGFYVTDNRSTSSKTSRHAASGKKEGEKKSAEKSDHSQSTSEAD